MTTARQRRGSETQTAVAAYLRTHGWPYAEPVGAGRGGSDVTGIPGLLCEVKARREFRPVEWLKQHSYVTHVQTDPPMLPFVVWRPDGMGPASIAGYGVMMRLDDFTGLLRQAGYGGE